jgi:hypothetical protein
MYKYYNMEPRNTHHVLVASTSIKCKPSFAYLRAWAAELTTLPFFPEKGRRTGCDVVELWGNDFFFSGLYALQVVVGFIPNP